MNYRPMLERMAWNCDNLKNDIDKIERITASLRTFLSKNEPAASAKSQYYNYWKYIAEQNTFICALLLKKQELIHGVDDFCTSQCRLAIQAELSQLIIDDVNRAGWHLLSEIATENNQHIIEYVRYLDSNGKLQKYINYLQYSPRIADNVAFFLRSCCIADGELRKTVLGVLTSFRWTIDVNDIVKKTAIMEAVNLLWKWNDISALISIENLFENIRIPEIVSLSIVECEDYLLTQKQPLSTILYRKMLQKEGLPAEEVINRLLNCTYWSSRIPSTIINDYLIFSYAVADLPENYDKYAAILDKYEDATSESSDDVICAWNDILGAESGRWYNYMLVDKPFISLIRKNPSRVRGFLDRISSISLYDKSRSLEYKKNQTWVPNNYEKEYKNFLCAYSNSHSKTETVDLYMGSPLKTKVDISFLIRLLFQPEDGFIYLTDVLDQYILRGKVIKKPTAEKNTSYQVSVSNAISSYRFPIHHSWIKNHYDEVEQMFNDSSPVFFKVMSINSRGMIFVHELARKPQPEKRVSEVSIETKVLKYLEKIIDGSLAFQGNNSPEKIRLFALVMLCNENRILVERRQLNNHTVDSLPFIQVSNGETSDDAIRRLLKYSVGFREELVLSPCGIRHICVERNERSIVFIYKILLSDCTEKQNTLIFKSSLQWRDIDEYREAADERTSVSILNAFDMSWSELTINYSRSDIINEELQTPLINDDSISG